MTTIAQTTEGALRGVSGDGIVAFRGVRYAAPPIGASRFAPPAPAESWSGVRDADRDGPIAPQGPSRLRDAMGDFTAPQDEDCLTLTIWTPGLDDARRAVMVWLHGGAWSSGAASLAWYDGGLLAREQGIVMVGVNYRLGALGYLCAEGISPGNLGTMDQAAALRWVRDNISAFGGDAGRVTLAGQSAGAASIGRLISDPATRPLLHRAILQSGGFGRPPLRREEAAAIGAEFVRGLGIDPQAPDAAARMRAVQVADLLAAQAALARARARFADTTPPFMPHVEDAPAHHDAIAEAAAGLPLMIGTTREEVHAFFAPNPAMTDPPAQAAAARFAALAGSADAIECYRQRRPGGTMMDLLADLGTDHTFGFPSLRLADALASRGSPVHAYRFDYAPPRSRFRACHCIELPFMFGTLGAWADAPMLAGGDPAIIAALSATLRGHWGRFVRGEELDWPRYDASRRMTMLFDDICGPVGDPSGMDWRT